MQSIVVQSEQNGHRYIQCVHGGLSCYISMVMIKHAFIKILLINSNSSKGMFEVKI